MSEGRLIILITIVLLVLGFTGIYRHDCGYRLAIS